ncbi:hypothetical protein QVG61_10885 [Thiohalobacter sp. IOR34]|uniref:hypothetical protein n=1 Tax=Thiohalobacter sp. IOR34 TaxID=3057176 RepID=UPI0025AFDF40|nr:hypothetical protein [Thiohalobacter sp. IOR34]WJW74998.1 hypothetical protein QVG61_10885 [Thiohalobacter sp. IOR34]
MFFKAVAGLVLLASGNALAGQFPLEIFEYFDDSKIVIYAREEAIQQAPAWMPETGAPPLGIGRLIEIGNQWISRDPRLQGAHIHEIELKPIRHHESQQRWYYLVQLQRADDSGKPVKTYLAVLLDGTVLPALREPAAYK